MKQEKRKELYKQLSYLGENFDFDNPEDSWAKNEYKKIKRQLGIPTYRKKNK